MHPLLSLLILCLVGCALWRMRRRYRLLLSREWWMLRMLGRRYHRYRHEQEPLWELWHRARNGRSSARAIRTPEDRRGS